MTCLAFDLDGTIYDCKNIIVQAFQQGITSFKESGHDNISVPDKEQIVSVLGTPHDLIFVNLFPDLDVLEQQKINDFCTKALVDMVNNGGGEIFDGVLTTLAKFHSEDYKILVASNGNINYIESILKSNKLDHYFSGPIVSLNDNIKDKIEIVKYYRENFCNNDLLIMIGDRESDKIAAQHNNSPFIGCSFGHADDSELHGAKWIAHEFNEIYSFVKEIELEMNNE